LHLKIPIFNICSGAVHHHVKFHRNILNGCGDMAILIFVQIAAVSHPGF